MLLLVPVAAADFLLPFLLIFGSIWLVQRKPIYSNGQHLTLWGAARVIWLFAVLVFADWYISDDAVNHVADWLGVSVRDSITFTLNGVRELLLGATWVGFLYFRAV